MTISTEAAKAAGQNQVTDADLVRICQSFNPGQDLDLAKAVRAAVAKAAAGHTESAPVGYVTASALEAGLDYPDWRSEFFRTAEALLDYFPTAEPVAVFTAPQTSAEVGITASHDMATVVAFIFERFGSPGHAGEIPAHVVAAVRRLEAGLQPQAGKDIGHMVGRLSTTVTDVMTASLASVAYRYAMTLSFATRHADCDQLEGIARRVTAKLKDEIHAIISGRSGGSS
ncbi:hypothetical protein [Achromobacter xylosoxidans]|uniref:hypothetical protein n=1 Tax=Alcaligenes xylosoxydans xylosoxydans TaxID=85698 RepID=UPI0022B8763A|nr:hypothetical protein [Achromobacter xylosoxidans]MCZ8388731.1 hypothetical protein [Achromobacter xylosoxidans]WOB70838.1 hypothetical protein PZA07_16190 [Achromobacter xylosoxidans]